MAETSIRDVFLSMQLPPVDEIAANSKTDFRTIRKSRRSCYRAYHVQKTEEATDTSNTILDELIQKMRTKNKHLKEHLTQENQAIEDLICKKREIELWRQLTNLVILPSNRKKSISDQLIAYDLNEKKTVEFYKDSNENAPLKTWNYISRHITDDLIESILHESGNHNNNNASSGQHAVKKARRTNDVAQKILTSVGKSRTSNTNTQFKAKRTTRRSRIKRNMAKAPLKQLSVNTFESSRILSPKSSTKKNAPVILDAQIKKKSAVCKQLIPIEEKSHDIPSLVQVGVRMPTNEFEQFIRKAAPDSYWHIMAEHYRIKLEEVTRENQQLHDIVDGLNKDNENLRAVADHCEYLTDIIERLTSDNDYERGNKSLASVRLF
ncbi:unnamed protein product [Rotaria magnacalcarata]|uniref:Uncharacterized protein n=3 Tax=Rotaria magnacalcarata TaxID=392030 RepID=A0A819UXC7_9BILA|nr:unnamed protein product [Rotaria magnacalcarata]CAF4100795.1 unnamed protein product [Rotaria magnacalcarata]